MKINETSEKVISLSAQSIKSAEKGIRFAGENLNAFNMDQEEERAEQLPESSIDMIPFLNRKEEKLFKKLSPDKKRKLMAETKKRYHSARAVRTMMDAKKDAEKLAGGAVETVKKEAVKTAAQTTSEAAAGTAAGAATGGVSAAVQAQKKAVDTFRRSLQAYSSAAREQAGKIQMEAENKDDAGNGGLGKTLQSIGSAIMVMLLVLAQTAMSVLSSIAAIVLAVIAAVLIIVAVIAAVVSFIVSLASNNIYTGGEEIVRIALTQEGNMDGTKYWEYVQGTQFVDGNVTPWCACFVSWCANECGYIDEGILPKSASVATYRSFFRQKGLLKEDGAYVPQVGDLILFGSDEHIGIVQYVEGGRVITIEGNTSDAVHTRSYDLDSSYITGYCTPEYPGGEAIVIPDGMGVYHTYMGWHTITSTTSRQYQLREASGEHYDDEGFARIDGRYVIACTSTFGEVGDYIDFYRENGDVIHAVIGDIKNQNDPGCNEYGHADGQCVVEYIVSQSWYPSHANPGTENCHPEWNYRVERAVNLGKNYFD